jgi:hypothetical protein
LPFLQVGALLVTLVLVRSSQKTPADLIITNGQGKARIAASMDDLQECEKVASSFAEGLLKETRNKELGPLAYHLRKAEEDGNKEKRLAIMQKFQQVQDELRNRVFPTAFCVPRELPAPEDAQTYLVLNCPGASRYCENERVARFQSYYECVRAAGSFPSPWSGPWQPNPEGIGPIFEYSCVFEEIKTSIRQGPG